MRGKSLIGYATSLLSAMLLVAVSSNILSARWQNPKDRPKRQRIS